MAQVLEDGFKYEAIIKPEILNLILGHLDSRGLKKARLVCKSWLFEAQRHLETRGLIVRLNGDEDSFPTRVRKFILTLQKKLLDLPQPFQSIELDMGKDEWRSEEVNAQLATVLLPPLVITRLNPGKLKLSLAIKLVSQHSSSLEYLRISLHERRSYEAELTQWLSLPDRNFPQLRHISLDTNQWYFESPSVNSFVRLIAGIVRASPKLETFESTSEEYSRLDELSSQLLLAVDIRDVKTLLLDDCLLNPPALQHFISYPFRQLENLGIIIRTDVYNYVGSEPALVATLAKSTATLKTLDIKWAYAHPENFAEFPVCPNVQELRLGAFPFSSNFVLDHFPSLQVLTAFWGELDVLGESWTALSPLLGIKTLRMGSVQLKRSGDNDLDEQLHLKFFEKFPGVERLRLDYSFAVDCCRVKAKSHPDVSNILGGLKHLELAGRHEVGWFEERDEKGNSLFAALNGIETVTLLKPNENLLLIPFQDMPSVKVLQFPWVSHRRNGPYLEMTKLLEVAKGLEKVVITNCCSFPRIGDPWASRALDSFFDSAPNAKCGCQDWEKILQ